MASKMQSLTQVFVMLQNTEHMEEIYRPLSVPSVNDVLTGEKIVEIEQATVGQAENPLWHGIRKGRITASNFYKVKTKVESLRKAGINIILSMLRNMWPV